MQILALAQSRQRMMGTVQCPLQPLGNIEVDGYCAFYVVVLNFLTTITYLVFWIWLIKNGSLFLWLWIYSFGYWFLLQKMYRIMIWFHARRRRQGQTIMAIWFLVLEQQSTTISSFTSYNLASLLLKAIWITFTHSMLLTDGIIQVSWHKRLCKSSNITYSEF